MKEKTQGKEIKRKSLNIDYDLARKLELKAAEMETTQTELINILTLITANQNKSIFQGGLKHG